MKNQWIIGLGCLWLVACSQHHPTAAPRQVEERLVAGQMQPLQSVQSIDGQQINLQQSDQRKLLIFFATWCHDSQRLMTQLQQSPLLKQQGLLIVGIGREENPESLRKFAAEYKLPFALVADPTRDLYHHFTNAGIPRVVLVDGQNRIVKSFLGEIPRAIDEIVWTEVGSAGAGQIGGRK